LRFQSEEGGDRMQPVFWLLSRHMHSPHLTYHSVVTGLRGDLERMQGQRKAVLP
jgi:hypothetical protein